MGTLSVNSYNRRESFGLGWADQWDYKFNDEKLLQAPPRHTPCKFGKENKSLLSNSAPAAAPLLNKKMMIGLNKKLLSAATTSALAAKTAANTGAHKVKAGTSMGIKWLKKQCSMKALKGQR